MVMSAASVSLPRDASAKAYTLTCMLAAVFLLAVGAVVWAAVIAVGTIVHRAAVHRR